MSARGSMSMALWAARDVLRQPGRSLLLAACLFTLAIVGAVPLLLTQALADTAEVLLGAGPSLVVRRVQAGGWAPVPIDEAVQSARAVVGVTSASPRIWGVVRASQGPVTVVGLEAPATFAAARGPAAARAADPTLGWGQLPELQQWRERLRPGSAIVGPGVRALRPGQPLELVGAQSLELEIVGALSSDLSMAAHDVVLVHADDARKLLGLPEAHASDLAIRVFHQQEHDAIADELPAAFPWPIQVSRQSEMIGSIASGASRRGSIAMMVLIPAVLALALVVVGAWRDGPGRRRELGLLKALGWTTGDLVRLRLYRALLVGVPAVLLGLAVSYRLVFWPATRWIGELLLGWSGDAVALTLLPSTAALIVAEVGAVVLLPYLGATVLSVLRHATIDPGQDLLSEP